MITQDVKNQLNPTGSCKNAYLALIILGLSIFAWNAYMYLFIGSDWVAKDPFNKQVFEWNWMENCCSWWPILHLISFTILGYLYPHCEKLLFIAGVMWEFLEVLMHYLTKGNVIKQPMRVTNQKVQYSDVWWAGSFKDILFNTMGIIIGRTIRLHCNPPNGTKHND
uniref:Transmembrane protein n=1 Tax=Marseillevirus LCMAC202 TaxID=2506606 RepID=A0A481YXG7_9VIRU|nr:MAG: uncharacterized protein LCMAC202_02290 [Marseillevirus LCMAC202]